MLNSRPDDPQRQATEHRIDQRAGAGVTTP